MKMDRNRWFLLGILLILLGFQFRMVESFVLNESTTRALARVTRDSPVASPSPMSAFVTNLQLNLHPKPTKRVSPPRWLGLAMIAGGVVISLQSIAMPKP